MSEENDRKFAESLTGIYEMLYGAIEYKAHKKNLEMPDCLLPSNLKKMDLSNVFALEETIDSVKILVDFIQKTGMVNEQTKANAKKFLEENKGKDNPAMDLVNKFIHLIKMLKASIKNKDIEYEYEEAIRMSEEAIKSILEERNAIEAVAQKVEKGGFPIDARKLVRNFLSASKQDAKKAYETLITNPAYFSPLILKGKMTLWRKLTGKGPKMPPPEVGQRINKQLAAFLKNLKF